MRVTTVVSLRALISRTVSRVARMGSLKVDVCDIN